MEKKIFTGSPISDDMGYPTDQQLNDILKACNSSRNKLLIILLSRTGRRVSEMLELRPCDIDYENKTINWHILKKKDKDYRVNIPADDYVLGVLKKYIAYHEIPMDKRVINICRSRVFQIVRMLGRRAGVERIGSKAIHPHHFRHYYAMKLAENSTSPNDIETVRDLLGHSSIIVTSHYFKQSGKKKRELISRAFA